MRPKIRLEYVRAMLGGDETQKKTLINVKVRLENTMLKMQE